MYKVQNLSHQSFAFYTCSLSCFRIFAFYNFPQDTSDPSHVGTSADCPDILALVPKCFTDTLAPRKALRHRATLDQAMAIRTAVLA